MGMSRSTHGRAVNCIHNFSSKPEGNTSFGRLTHKLEDNNKLDIKIMAEHSNETFGSIKCEPFNSFSPHTRASGRR